MTIGFGAMFRASAARLVAQAESAGWFDQIVCLTDQSTTHGVPDFQSKTAELRRQHPAGYGLWSWKPLLVKNVLASLPEGAHLYYIDSGCEISPLGEERFNQLDQILDQQAGLFFQIPFVEKEFSKPSLLAEFPTLADTLQVQATWFGIQVSAQGRALIDEWLTLCWEWDFARLKNDAAAPASAHRQDQSVLSCLLKSRYRELSLFPWEDFFAPWLYCKNSEILLAPIHALRTRGDRSSLASLVSRSTKLACEASKRQGPVIRFARELPLRLKCLAKDELVILLNRLRR